MSIIVYTLLCKLFFSKFKFMKEIEKPVIQVRKCQCCHRTVRYTEFLSQELYAKCVACRNDRVLRDSNGYETRMIVRPDGSITYEDVRR